MRFYQVLLLACVSLSVFANEQAPKRKTCGAAVWGIAAPLYAFDNEDLEFFRWRAERLKSEIGHWLADPLYYNKAMAPSVGFELDEAFAHIPGAFVYKTRLQNLYRATEHWLLLIEFMRLFREPLFDSAPGFSHGQMRSLWNFCESRITQTRGFSNTRNAQTDLQVRSMALAVVQTQKAPHYLRSFIKMHLEVMDGYLLPHAGVLQDLVNDLYWTYKDEP